MLKRVFHSCRRKGRVARARLCVGAAPRRALTPLTLCAPFPLFLLVLLDPNFSAGPCFFSGPAGPKQGELRRIFFHFVSPAL